MNIAIVISGIGLALAIFGAIANLFYKLGQHSARLNRVEEDSIKLSLIGDHTIRIQALEIWRQDIRKDMHEISDKMTQVITDVHGVRTLIEERTERRKFDSPTQSIWQEKERRDKG
jgi:hypothetical protein